MYITGDVYVHIEVGVLVCRHVLVWGVTNTCLELWLWYAQIPIHRQTQLLPQSQLPIVWLCVCGCVPVCGCVVVCLCVVVCMYACVSIYRCMYTFVYYVGYHMFNTTALRCNTLSAVHQP
eukprot:GHVQ01034387.1.p2 GENE.GHVQ01034387.1~~GHVQ01034387.1.p2  ORF type:complete len:120 (-),score=14.93 GHVQ01034387.1:125-484(-)